MINFLESFCIVGTPNHEHPPIYLHVVLRTRHEIDVCVFVFKDVVILLAQSTLLSNGISDAPSEHFPGLFTLVRMHFEHGWVGSEFGHYV